MDLTVSADQQALADAVRAVCAKHGALDDLRRREWAEDVVRPDAWQALADTGVFDLRVPEGDGGLGLGLADAAVVFEELGRALVPGPLVATELAHALGLPGGTGPAVAGGIAGAGAAGAGVVGAAVDGPGPVVVEHLPALDTLVVRRDRARALAVLDRAAVRAAGPRPAGRALDPLGPRWVLAGPLAGHDVTAVRAPAGDPVADPWARWCRDEQVLTGALAVGIAAATCELAVAYAGQRQQFGRPIGSFQAVKHLCADMLVRAETARAAVHAAAVTADQPDTGDPVRAAAGAALLATEAAVSNARSCVQVHGGTGFTWEVPVHLYLTRAKVLAATVGPAAGLARTVAERW